MSFWPTGEPPGGRLGVAGGPRTSLGHAPGPPEDVVAVRVRPRRPRTPGRPPTTSRKRLPFAVSLDLEAPRWRRSSCDGDLLTRGDGKSSGVEENCCPRGRRRPARPEVGMATARATAAPLASSTRAGASGPRSARLSMTFTSRPDRRSRLQVAPPSGGRRPPAHPARGDAGRPTAGGFPGRGGVRRRALRARNCATTGAKHQSGPAAFRSMNASPASISDRLVWAAATPKPRPAARMGPFAWNRISSIVRFSPPMDREFVTVPARRAGQEGGSAEITAADGTGQDLSVPPGWCPPAGARGHVRQRACYYTGLHFFHCSMYASTLSFVTRRLPSR